MSSSHTATVSDLQPYYEACLGISLERQIGNRYFVLAANAAKIYFLREAAIEFLRYTCKDTGNKLEQSMKSCRAQA